MSIRDSQPGGEDFLDPYVHAPSGLLEQELTRMYPHATIDHLRDLQAIGWSRLGVATAVVNERGEVLMLDHAGSEKVSEGAVGPMMETSRVNMPAGTVESTEQTVYRAFQEELGVEDPDELGLKGKLVGAWTLHTWTAGDKKTDEMVMGINPVVVMPNEKADKIRRFIRTDEIRTAAFRPIEAIQYIPNLRPGVIGWLGGLTSRGLLDRQHGAFHSLHFDTNGLHDPGWQDAVFANLDL